MWAEWIEAMRGGEPAACAFDRAGPLTEIMLFGQYRYSDRKAFEMGRQEYEIDK